ncbi:MAG: tetratricopeptide repeat protein [Candidatus Melainabacteria bacterium]|nr:MAG: tetratricopeptide repeat protein [Candidatus Melainabacteria bacterium]
MDENVIVEAQEEESNIDKALKAAWNKDYNSAIDILKNELTTTNETSYIHSLIASYYIKLNEINKARESLDKALKKLPVYQGSIFFAWKFRI